MEFVSAGFGGKGQNAAAGLTVLGLEAVRVYRYFGNGFDGWGCVGDLLLIGGTVGGDGQAVHRGVPCARLTAAER